MDYEKKYKEEVARATRLCKLGIITRKNLEYIFPELKESVGEKIRTAILNHLNKMWEDCQDDICGVNVEDAIDWLEKQGEQKSFDYENAHI